MRYETASSEVAASAPVGRRRLRSRMVSVRSASAAPAARRIAATLPSSRTPRLMKPSTVAAKMPTATQMKTRTRHAQPSCGPGSGWSAATAASVASSTSPAARQPRAASMTSAARSAARQADLTAPP